MASRIMKNPSRALIWIWYFFLLGIVSWASFVLSDYPYDDAYIHFRIARNLAIHGLPYYQLDQALMSSSSTLWTILLAFVFLIFGTHIKLIALLNALFVVLSAFVWARASLLVLNKRSLRIELVLSGLVCALLFEAGFGLMETPMAMFLIGLAWLLYLRGDNRAFLFAGAACFARPELALFAFGLFVLQVWKRRLGSVRALVNFVLGLTPFLIFNLYYFARIFPHTAAAKKIVYHMSFVDSLGFSLGQLLNIGFVGQHLQAFVLYGCFLFAWLLLMIFKGSSHWFRAELRRILPERLAWYFLPPALILFGYAFSGVLTFPWYAPLYSLPLMLGLAFLAICSGRRTALLLLVLPFAFRFVQQIAAAGFGVQHSPEFPAGARVRSFLHIAGELNKRYPDKVLMAPEIGALGYVYHGQIKDACGLTSPEALAYHPLKIPEERASGKIGAIPPEYVKSLRPDIIVTLPFLAEALLKSEVVTQYTVKKAPLFLQDDLARSGETQSVWGQEMILILLRKE